MKYFWKPSVPVVRILFLKHLFYAEKVLLLKPILRVCTGWVVVRGGWSLTLGSYVTLADPSENLFPITATPLPLHFNRLTLLPCLARLLKREKEAKTWICLASVLKTRSKMFFQRRSYQCFPQTTNLSLVNIHWTYKCYTQTQRRPIS